MNAYTQAFCRAPVIMSRHLLLKIRERVAYWLHEAAWWIDPHPLGLSIDAVKLAKIMVALEVEEEIETREEHVALRAVQELENG